MTYRDYKRIRLQQIPSNRSKQENITVGQENIKGLSRTKKRRQM